MNVVVADFSNSEVRVTKMDSYGASRLPNYIVWHDKMPVVDELNNAWANTAKTKTFHLKWKRSDYTEINDVYTVGEAAQAHQNPMNPIGVEKFSATFLPILVASGLLSTYPNVENKDYVKVTLGMLHPLDYTREMLYSINSIIKGKYNITSVDGRKLNFEVTDVKFLPETMAGAYYVERMITDIFGKVSRKEVVMISDSGFGTSQIFLWDRNKQKPIGQASRTLDIGGRKYVDEFAKWLATQAKSKMNNNADRVPINDNLFFALNNGYYPLHAGDTIDCANFVKMLSHRFANDFQALYTIPKEHPIDAIALVGGTSLLFGKRLVEKVFHQFTWDYNAKLVSSNSDTIRLANLMGFTFKIKEWLSK